MRTKEKEKSRKMDFVFNLSNFRATSRHPEIIFMVDFLGKYLKNAGYCQSVRNYHP